MNEAKRKNGLVCCPLMNSAQAFASPWREFSISKVLYIIHLSGQVHLATVDCFIACILEKAAERLLQHIVGHGSPSGVTVLAHSNGAWHKTCLQAEPVRYTDGVAGIGSFKPDTRSSKSIHCRRLEPFVSRATHHAGMLLIGHDEEDIGPALLFWGRRNCWDLPKHQSSHGTCRGSNEFPSFHVCFPRADYCLYVFFW